MKLNGTDEKALKWILDKEKVRITDVVKGNCPDFVLRNGNSYEAKRLYGTHVLLFTQEQWNVLVNSEKCELLVFADDNGQPRDVINCEELNDGRWDGVYEFRITDDLGVRANIWLSRTLYGDLQMFARQKGFETNDLIREILDDYVHRKALATKEE